MIMNAKRMIEKVLKGESVTRVISEVSPNPNVASDFQRKIQRLKNPLVRGAAVQLENGVLVVYVKKTDPGLITRDALNSLAQELKVRGRLIHGQRLKVCSWDGDVVSDVVTGNATPT